MALKDYLVKIKDLSMGEKELLYSVLPLVGGYSGATGTEGISLATDYTPPTTSDGFIRRVFCAGNAGNVKFDMADGSVHVLPIYAEDWLCPVAGFITKIYSSANGTTATTLKVFW